MSYVVSGVYKRFARLGCVKYHWLRMHAYIYASPGERSTAPERQQEERLASRSVYLCQRWPTNTSILRSMNWIVLSTQYALYSWSCHFLAYIYHAGPQVTKPFFIGGVRAFSLPRVIRSHIMCYVRSPQQWPGCATVCPLFYVAIVRLPFLRPRDSKAFIAHHSCFTYL